MKAFSYIDLDGVIAGTKVYFRLKFNKLHHGAVFSVFILNTVNLVFQAKMHLR